MAKSKTRCRLCKIAFASKAELRTHIANTPGHSQNGGCDCDGCNPSKRGLTDNVAPPPIPLLLFAYAESKKYRILVVSSAHVDRLQPFGTANPVVSTSFYVNVGPKSIAKNQNIDCKPKKRDYSVTTQRRPS
jgi:hypothetical protein